MKNYLLLLAVVIGFASCEKDGDKIYLNSIESGELVATQSAVVLSKAINNDIVLSLAWTKDALQISDPSLEPIDVTIQTIQASLSEDFSGTVVESTEMSLSKAYTGKALNVLARNVGTTPDVANEIYFRLAAQTGKNIAPVYSNVVKVTVTPYFLDMTVGTILSKVNEAPGTATGETLYSPDADGIYTGFIGATSWYNFYMEEGDGTIWGNDDVTGTAFVASSASTRWGFWLPEPAGCYYTIVNTVDKKWSALLIPTLTLAGDLTGEMTFDRKNTRWMYVFNAAQEGNITFKASATGKQYNVSTGDKASTDAPVGFAQNGEGLAFGDQAGDITVNVPATGECTLIIDLSKPQQWTAKVISGAIEEEPEETVAQCVYLPGIDNSDPWTYTDEYSLPLYDESTLTYAGLINVNSLYKNYQISVAQSWQEGTFYTWSTGDEMSGSLYFGNSGTNVPAPEDGLYFFEVSLANLTYQLTAVTGNIYIAGLNDDWSFTPLQETSESGVFSASVTINAASRDGFQVLLFNGNWSYYYGGASGQLAYRSSNIKDDQSMTPGAYTLTVNLNDGTYTIE